MVILGAKVKLTIDEPWDLFRVIEGKIIKQFSIEDGSYLLFIDLRSSEYFVLSPRYKNENFINLKLDKKLIVAIAVPSEKDNFTDDYQFINNLKYIGIGSIELSPLIE